MMSVFNVICNSLDSNIDEMSNHYIVQQKELVRELKKTIELGKSRSTFVEMRHDYENDEAICLTSVVFVPENLAQSISARITNPLQKIDSQHFYYSKDLMHLTIKNIRTINNPPLFSNDDIVKVKQVFEKIVSSHEAFTFTVEDVILFPTSVALIGYSSQSLQKLVQALDFELNSVGVPDNKTYFSNTVFFGNLTVCRFTHSPSLEFGQQVKALETTHIGEMYVSELHLITCNSVCHSQTRSIIATYTLGSP